MKKIITKSFPKGSKFRKSQHTVIRNGIPNKGSGYKEQVSVSIDSCLLRDYTERMLINRVETQVGILIVQNVV